MHLQSMWGGCTRLSLPSCPPPPTHTHTLTHTGTTPHSLVPGSYREKVWDHAPGSLLLTEAGGVVSDASGQPLDFSLGRELSKNAGIVGAATPQLHSATLNALKALALKGAAATGSAATTRPGEGGPA